MAAASIPTRSLVSQSIIEGLIVEVAPRMEFTEQRSFKRVYSVLQASVDSVAAAYRDVGRLPAVIAAERQRVAAAGPICMNAFELFVENSDIGD